MEHGAYIQLKRSVKRMDYDNDALDWAASYGHLEIVKYLIEKKAYVTDETLIWCTNDGQIEMVKYLMEYKKTTLNWLLRCAKSNRIV